jgi:hypothetical protein
MVGLYKKALTYRPDLAATSRGGDSPAALGEWVSPDEQIEIMSELSALAEPRKLSATDETFSFAAARNDHRLPVLINLAAVVLLILASLALYYHFSRREHFITSGQSAFLTTEGLLLEAVRRDAQSQMGEKDRQIAEIQRRLTSLNQEQQQLRLAGEARMRQREEELKAAMSRTLDAERERLKTQGLSAQELELRLRTLQEQFDSRNQQDLDALRRQVDSERSQREAALRSLEAEFRGNLDRLGGEKARLEEQLRLREQELGERLRREKALMEGELARSAESLDRLNELRRQEQQVSDQLLSFYEQLRGNLARQDYPQALLTLSALETFLSREPIASLPVMLRRRPLELFVIDSFRTLIDRQRSSSGQSVDSLLAAAELLASLQQTVAQADQFLRAGRNEEARSRYLAALGKIPEIQRSHAVVRRMEQEAWEAERRALEARVEAFQAGSASADQEWARRERQLRLEIDSLRAQIAQKQEDFEQKAVAEKRGRLLERLQALRSRHEELIARSPVPATTPQQELTGLLETKLLLKEILVSEPVRTRHPDLYAKTERLFAAFGEMLQLEGQLAALRDLDLITTSLSGEKTGEVDSVVLGRYAGAELRDLFGKLLDALRLMIP